MRIDYLTSDILLFRGDSLAALATAFIDGERVLLVDGLASQYDALDLRDYLENSLRKRVEQIVLTDPQGGHAAAVALFPGAQVRTWSAQPARIVWGRHTLELFAAAGSAPQALAIDVASADLLLAPDRLIGNIAVLGTGSPEQADEALLRLQDRGRNQVIPRHVGAACSRVLGSARAYLAQLRTRVLAARGTLAPDEAAQRIAAIRIEDCLAAGEVPTPLERHWHADNLKQIVARGLFPAPAAALRQPVRSRAQACCDTLASVLTSMLGRLVERGV